MGSSRPLIWELQPLRTLSSEEFGRWKRSRSNRLSSMWVWPNVPLITLTQELICFYIKWIYRAWPKGRCHLPGELAVANQKSVKGGLQSVSLKTHIDQQCGEREREETLLGMDRQGINWVQEFWVSPKDRPLWGRLLYSTLLQGVALKRVPMLIILQDSGEYREPWLNQS